MLMGTQVLQLKLVWPVQNYIHCDTVPSEAGTCRTKQFVCLVEMSRSYRESFKWWKERQGPTLGVHFTRCPFYRVSV